MEEKHLDTKLIAELDMPSDSSTVRLKAPSWGVGKKGRIYHFELFGIYLGAPTTESSSGPIVEFRGKHKSEECKAFQVWQQSVICEGSRVRGEMRWHPSRGEQIAMYGLEHAKGKSEVEDIWEGIKLFPLVRQQLPWISSEGFKHVPAGRPRGSVALTRNSFIQMAVDAYKKIYENNYFGAGKHPTQTDVAQELLIARATLNRYIRSYGVTWKDIRKRAISAAR